jgi:hypothetical protein
MNMANTDEESKQIISGKGTPKIKQSSIYYGGEKS